MTTELDPLSLVYNGIVKAISDDEFVKAYHDNKNIFMDFIPLPDLPNTTNPQTPARNMPKMSLMQDTVLWGPNNSCSGRIDLNINLKVTGYGTRSSEFNPLIFQLLKITRPGQLHGTLHAIHYQGNSLRTICRGGNASYEHDDERQVWSCTIPIEIQIFL